MLTGDANPNHKHTRTLLFLRPTETETPLPPDPSLKFGDHAQIESGSIVYWFTHLLGEGTNSLRVASGRGLQLVYNCDKHSSPSSF